jgi:hypothetical protein
MREVSLPTGSSPLHASGAACIAAILECDVAAVPLPPADHPEPWTVWRNWLAGRRAGLVPIVDPGGFSWPGPWLALLPGRESADLVAAVAFGSPPGLAWTPIATRPFEEVRQGFVIAPHDLAASGTQPDAAALEGRVEAILVAASVEDVPQRLEHAAADEGRGLRGDRYHAGGGTFTNRYARGLDLTLIEQETIEALREVFPDYRAEDTRRNVVTSGIRLNDLVGKRFRVGEVDCFGQRLCEPCAHLDRATGIPALRPLVHRGGLRADIVGGGTIRVGDAVTVQPPA